MSAQKPCCVKYCDIHTSLPNHPYYSFYTVIVRKYALIIPPSYFQLAAMFRYAKTSRVFSSVRLLRGPVFSSPTAPHSVLGRPVPVRVHAVAKRGVPSCDFSSSSARTTLAPPGGASVAPPASPSHETASNASGFTPSSGSDAGADFSGADGAGGAAASEEAEAQQRAAVLDSALRHVPELGWSEEALLKALSEHGLSPASIGLFPHGAADLVEHFVATANASAIAQLQERPDFDTMRVSDLLSAGIKTRLALNVPYLSRLSQSLAVSMRPESASPLLAHVAYLCDDLWHLAGDTSADASWYTKRASLAAVYVASELYMITDKSPDFQDTWAFVDRRIHVRYRSPCAYLYFFVLLLLLSVFTLPPTHKTLFLFLFRSPLPPQDAAHASALPSQAASAVSSAASIAAEIINRVLADFGPSAPRSPFATGAPGSPADAATSAAGPGAAHGAPGGPSVISSPHLGPCSSAAPGLAAAASAAAAGLSSLASAFASPSSAASSASAAAAGIASAAASGLNSLADAAKAVLSSAPPQVAALADAAAGAARSALKTAPPQVAALADAAAGVARSALRTAPPQVAAAAAAAERAAEGAVRAAGSAVKAAEGIAAQVERARRGTAAGVADAEVVAAEVVRKHDKEMDAHVKATEAAEQAAKAATTAPAFAAPGGPVVAAETKA